MKAMGRDAAIAAGLILSLATASPGWAQAIIDMHLHALPADAQGPPPVYVCAPYDAMPMRDPRWDAPTYAGKTFSDKPACAHPVISAKTDAELREQSLAELRRYDILAVTSGPPDFVAAWRKAEPKRILPAVYVDMADPPPVEALRALHAAGQMVVLGEIAAQYEGVAPNDPKLEPYWALAEELDIPAAIHIGPGPPGAAYLGLTKYRASLSDPLLLEDVLIRHPKLRLYVMHAGWPNIDRMMALLYAHPQVYVDVAVIDFTQPRAEFHRYLRRLVEAGYGDRIMFGSDQMVWPGAIGAAIEAITSADFLTPAQKKAILHDNAARFLRLDEKR
jgi:predicted TIM-barrel fold metal-dependent hydrolase